MQTIIAPNMILKSSNSKNLGKLGLVLKNESDVYYGLTTSSLFIGNDSDKVYDSNNRHIGDFLSSDQLDVEEPSSIEFLSVFRLKEKALRSAKATAFWPRGAQKPENCLNSTTSDISLNEPSAAGTITSISKNIRLQSEGVNELKDVDDALILSLLNPNDADTYLGGTLVMGLDGYAIGITIGQLENDIVLASVFDVMEKLSASVYLPFCSHWTAIPHLIKTSLRKHTDEYSDLDFGDPPSQGALSWKK